MSSARQAHAASVQNTQDKPEHAGLDLRRTAARMRARQDLTRQALFSCTVYIRVYYHTAHKLARIVAFSFRLSASVSSVQPCPRPCFAMEPAYALQGADRSSYHAPKHL